MTTFDPDTLHHDPNVLRDIVRRFGGKLALNCEVLRGGVIEVGQEVQVLTSMRTRVQSWESNAMTKTLFAPACVEEVKRRMSQLRPDSQRQWGKMTPAQALAHCSGGMRMATGDLKPPRLLIGRIIGRIIKPLVLGDKPMRRNAPTADDLLVRDDRDLDTEREQLSAWVDRFAAAGPAGCTTHPHSLFGQLTPAEWATLMYKHLDHHLRQFGV